MIDVTAGIIVCDRRILIAQRGNDKDRALQWELPGGKIQKNESFEECLKRELNEEFGIDTNIGKHFMSYRHQYPDIELTLHAYYVKKLKGTFKLNEHRRIAWINVEDYTKYKMAEADLPIMEELIRNL